MANIALVRPESDNVELGLSSWASLVLTSVGGKSSVNPVDLRAHNVTKPAVSTAMGAQELTLFFLHGQRDRLGDPTVYVDASNVGNGKGSVLIPFLLSKQSIESVRAALEVGFQQIEQHYRSGLGARHPNANMIWMSAHINWRGLVLHGDQHATIL